MDDSPLRWFGFATGVDYGSVRSPHPGCLRAGTKYFELKVVMRLLFIIKGLVEPGGGAERVLAELVNALSSRGYSIDVATFDRPNERPFYSISENVRMHAIEWGDPGRPVPRSTMPMVIGSLRRIAQTVKPDTAVAFMHSTYIPVAFALLGTGIPLIASEHTAAAHFASRPIQRSMTRVAQRMAFAKTVVSQQVYDEHPKGWRKNLYILPNPVDLDSFASAKGKWPSENVIVCVGGLRPEKDQLTLISAFDRVADAFPEWRLRLVGDGSERPAIEARIAASPHRARIELPGVIRDVAAEYANASIIAMPSRYESLGMVAIEAMASGRPVVGFSDCVGAATLIQHRINGLLAEPGANRAQALADTLHVLMADQKLRFDLGANAPATVEHYSLDAIVSQWEQLLIKAAASPVRPLAGVKQRHAPPCEPGQDHD